MRFTKKAGYKRPAYKSFEYYLRKKELQQDNLLFILDDIIILVDDTAPNKIYHC